MDRKPRRIPERRLIPRRSICRPYPCHTVEICAAELRCTAGWAAEFGYQTWDLWGAKLLAVHTVLLPAPAASNNIFTINDSIWIIFMCGMQQGYTTERVSTHLLLYKIQAARTSICRCDAYCLHTLLGCGITESDGLMFYTCLHEWQHMLPVICPRSSSEIHKNKTRTKREDVKCSN